MARAIGAVDRARAMVARMLEIEVNTMAARPVPMARCATCSAGRPWLVNVQHEKRHHDDAAANAEQVRRRTPTSTPVPR